MSHGLNSIQEQIVEIHQKLYQLGFSVGNDGNTSCRTSEDLAWITPAGYNKAHLAPTQITQINVHSGEIMEGESAPSTEWQLHAEIYKTHPEIQSIVHAHPPCAIACSLADISLERWILPELVIAIGPVPTLSYTCPGTVEIAKQAAEGLRGHKAVILQRHGVVTVGATLKDALVRMESVEHAARILLLAHGASRNISELSKNQKSKLEKQIETVYEKGRSIQSKK